MLYNHWLLLLNLLVSGESQVQAVGRFSQNAATQIGEFSSQTVYLATGCPNLFFPRAGVANVCTWSFVHWVFGARNSSLNHFWGDFHKMFVNVKIVLFFIGQPVCLCTRPEIKGREFKNDFFDGQLLFFSGFLKFTER